MTGILSRKAFAPWSADPVFSGRRSCKIGQRVGRNRGYAESSSIAFIGPR